MMFVSGATSAFEFLVLDKSDQRMVMNYIVLGSHIEIMFSANWEPSQVASKFH